MTRPPRHPCVTGAARRPGERAEGAEGAPDPAAGGGLFRRLLVITVRDPKAILFFISCFVQFVDPRYADPAPSFALLALVYQVIGVAYVTALILGGTYLATRLRRRKLSAASRRGGGAVPRFRGEAGRHEQLSAPSAPAGAHPEARDVSVFSAAARAARGPTASGKATARRRGKIGGLPWCRSGS
ncbi:LysE family transporter [Streptomyces sp. NPDC007883]|uniref:LysE family transporter n=1 Tax=Streptomyces sp. NPDC007883 TaxID=3155116 RepID=UPI0033CF85E2